MARFTNVHTHIFNTDCAPDRFLLVIPSSVVRTMPWLIKAFLSTRATRASIHWLSKQFSKLSNRKHGAARSAFDKYIAFLNIGTQNSQLEVFQKAIEAGQKVENDLRIVALTLNMDYMDSEPNTSASFVNYTTQLEEVKNIKRSYPNNLFPFLSIDPRQAANQALVDWSKQYFERGFRYNGNDYPYFCGIKLYPALGFFPFDPKMELMYKYAEEKGLPIMSHCTRVGSQYIGNYIENLISRNQPMFGNMQDEEINKAKTSIYARIDRYFAQKDWIKNNKKGNNDFACDLFGHPENYIPLMRTFPNLRICLAHMGGSNEIRMLEDLKKEGGLDDIIEARKIDGVQWFDKIWQLMKIYPNLYTDISYTVSSFEENNDVLKRVQLLMNDTDNDGKPLSERVLFGTDFFMTEQETYEVELYNITKRTLGLHYDAVTRTNIERYLGF
jgi:uncharacterized protein